MVCFRKRKKNNFDIYNPEFIMSVRLWTVHLKCNVSWAHKLLTIVRICTQWDGFLWCFCFYVFWELMCSWYIALQMNSPQPYWDYKFWFVEVVWYYFTDYWLKHTVKNSSKSMWPIRSVVKLTRWKASFALIESPIRTWKISSNIY